MITYLLLFLTIGIGVWSIYLFFSATRRPVPGAAFTAALSVAMGFFIYLYGTWVFLSIYSKYAFGGAYVLLALLFLLTRKTNRKSGSVVVKTFFTLLLALGCVLYFTGTTGRAGTVELDFPLKKGRYFVLQGGKGLPTNLFHFSLRGAVYAMDIVKLDNMGRRAGKIFSSRLEDYAIYGDTIYAPCDGVVTRAYGDNPDNIPPNMQRGPKNTNLVLIETPDYYVFMAHLQQGGVFVKEGDVVKTGHPLGRVGNSGFSTEPHLHIQVHAREEGKAWYASTPLYIHFNGKGYLLNEMIRKKDL